LRKNLIGYRLCFYILYDLPGGRKEKNRRGADDFLCAKKHLIHGGSIRAAVFLCPDSSHGGIKGGCRHDAPDAVTA
jgi:hypothetical protein